MVGRNGCAGSGDVNDEAPQHLPVWQSHRRPRVARLEALVFTLVPLRPNAAAFEPGEPRRELRALLLGRLDPEYEAIIDMAVDLATNDAQSVKARRQSLPLLARNRRQHCGGSGGDALQPARKDLYGAVLCRTPARQRVAATYCTDISNVETPIRHSNRRHLRDLLALHDTISINISNYPNTTRSTVLTTG